jgi:hypothetical protein
VNVNNTDTQASATNTDVQWTHLFSRQPLSAFGRLTVIALLGSVVPSGILAIIIGLPNNIALLIVTAALFVIAGFAATGFRWIAPLVALLNGVFLYQIVTQPFVIEHLVNPKVYGFISFILDLLLSVCLFIAFGAAIGATVQNYRRGSRQAPRWLSSALTGIGGIVIGAILISAIAQPATATTTGTLFTNGVPTVHMSAGNFNQTSVTIPKGFKLLLIDDVSSLHILVNGSWENGSPKSANEPSAPFVHNIQVNGSQVIIGPFTTEGTYHIYCAVHQGMNLTIIVE